MSREEHIGTIRQKYGHLQGVLNERTRRLWAATEAQAVGHHGVSVVCAAIKIDHKTVQAGLREIHEEIEGAAPNRIRRPGGGRKKLTETDPKLKDALNALVEPTTRGDPESPLRWTTTSTANLTEALQRGGHSISPRSVSTLLHEENYSLQSNNKTQEGKNHPDRDAQFRFISESAKQCQTKNQPIISVDTKKKELIGNYKNQGKEWRKTGNPRKVKTHDFPDKKLGKVAPYGILDVLQNEGWVNVGIDHDTASFAVESIRRWWTRMGRMRYAHATELTITADCGGSNANRSRLWKVELQKLADETNLTIHVRHFPPGTSKWNKIEHRLFSYISRNWRGRPLIDRATVVNLIAHTKTKAGLTVQAVLDENTYEIGIKISDAELARVNLHTESFHGEWNYRIEPRGG